MEVPYVKHLIINQLIDSPQLGRRKLPGKQVEHCGRSIFHIMAYMHQCILQNLEMVERQAFHLRHRCPASIVFIRQLFEPSVNLHQCQVSDSHNAVYFLLVQTMKTFQPQHILRVTGTVFRSIRLKLGKLHILQARQLIQHPLGRLIQILIVIDKAARQLHVIISVLGLFPHLPYQQDTELLSIKPNQHTVHRYM